MKLKTVQATPAAASPKQEAAQENSVASILARRIAWAPSDSEDDDDDDDSDWD